MKISVPAEKYIVAVSGGVDSMVLLDLLVKEPDVKPVVAHFNHGIRPEAGKDEAFVRSKAEELRLPYEAGYGHLGAAASEEAARDARYNFLRTVQKKHDATAIITAHHQDDLIETAILNLLRGTGHKGLTAISNNKQVYRPLLKYPKSQIISYAERNDVKWREDASNSDDVYLRNYVRNKLMPKLNPSDRESITLNIDKVAEIEKTLNPEIAKLSHYVSQDSLIRRNLFALLPAELGSELVVYWLRQQHTTTFDRKTVNRLNVALRTAKAGTEHSVKKDLTLRIGQKTARFSHAV